MGEAELNAEAGLDSQPVDDGDLAPLDAVIAERDEWKDRALRAIAETENVKRRAETQANDARAYAIQRFARDLLGVADNLERAIQAAPKDAEGAAAGLVSGLELTQKSLLQAFESNNLKRVAPEPGEAFDPHLHQAMMEQPSDTVQGGQVIQTLQAGYALFGRTVRPAMVVVAAKGSGAAAGAGYAPGGNYDGKA
ncbi:nucleotide exchange factor GrpE [Brevundimonas sp. S30B]|uniref:nucleotide exchange factor GrpE n=1 Tax=unclassified Brevundimonas TaxID=2622653 RepID=UPI001072EA32|nr:MULTISPECIES: nucleotide exchange factor GrpE [unclassified Brevundimonas]QBX38834.1 nucleotide exchange factor GrpE [Brevundimonas sp. MF30-B]TFW00924.1 nucleotide exchange factor GrpE [Brevundimonas sp. S30B]